MFEPFLSRWGLVADGAPVATPTGRLLPVRRGTTPAMLKIATEDEERRGAALLTWWQGDGAARVLAHEGSALLMERATRGRTLATMAYGGDDRDDGATRILCRVAARLHAPRSPAVDLPPLVPLTRWFRDLEPAAASHGGAFARAAAVARTLLAAPGTETVLHGDLHHGNVLDFAPEPDTAADWRVIDPKGLIGDRAFDFAILFCDPDLDDPSRPVATRPGRFARRLEIVTQAAALDRSRLLRWIVAWTGLSAAWFLADGDEVRAGIDLNVGAMAAAALDQ